MKANQKQEVRKGSHTRMNPRGLALVLLIAACVVLTLGFLYMRQDSAKAVSVQFVSLTGDPGHGPLPRVSYSPEMPR
jgi:hypothetical protein